MTPQNPEGSARSEDPEWGAILDWDAPTVPVDALADVLQAEGWAWLDRIGGDFLRLRGMAWLRPQWPVRN